MNRQQRRAQGAQSAQEAVGKQEPILSDEKVRSMAQLVSDIFEGTKKLVVVSEATPDIVDGVSVIHYRHTCYIAEATDNTSDGGSDD